MAQNQMWKDDEKPKNDLRSYVAQNLKRNEIFDFVKRDYMEYCGSRY